MKRKGFTLLELIIVIIILGVLATLGFSQYAAMIERSRGAEAREIAGNIRKLAAAFRMENGTLLPAGNAFNAARAGMGLDDDQIPTACHGLHYFSYALLPAPTATTISVTATRCTDATPGKNPNAPVASTLILTSNLATGVDTWTGTGGY